LYGGRGQISFADSLFFWCFFCAGFFGMAQHGEEPKDFHHEGREDREGLDESSADGADDAD
jgi:hypothetical protein